MKLKRLFSTLLVASMTISAFAMQPINSSAVDMEQKNINSTTFSAGGFISDDSKTIDGDYGYFFEADTLKDARKIIREQSIGKEDYDISDKLNDKRVVSVDISDREARSIKNITVEKNYNVNGCADETGEDELTQWYLDAMNVGETENSSVYDKVKVAVLDSGVSYVSALENVEHVNFTGEDDDINPIFYDANGHGTAIAGLIAGNGEIKGVNPNVALYDVKVLDSNLQAPLSRIIEGIYWAIDNDIDIINMSFGTTQNSNLLHEAVIAAENAGIMLIASAGNDSSQGVMYPAAYPEVIAVGATDSNGDYVNEYSNGDSVELYAPGTQIISTGMLDGFSSGCGTSLSAAEITGVASRLMEKDGATADFVRALLQITGKTVEGSAARLVDLDFALNSYDEAYEQYVNNQLQPVDFANNTAPESYDVGGIVTGLWSGTTHNWLVNSSVQNFENNGYTISNSKIYNLRFAAYYCDAFKKYYVNNYNGERKHTKGLHGYGVYTTNLKAVWYFAYYTKLGYNQVNAYNAALNQISSSELYLLHNEPNTYNNTDDATTAKALFTLRKFMYSVTSGDYEDYLEEGVNVTPVTTSDGAKKYLAVGIGMHLIGDTYAHRTEVPQYLITNTQTNWNNTDTTNYASNNSSDYASYFRKNDFYTVADHDNDKYTWNDLKQTYQNGGKIYFTELGKYFKKPEEQGINVGLVYIDNAKFARERLNTALQVSKAFLINAAIDDSPNPAVFSQVTNVQLKLFNAYMAPYTS